MGTNYQIINYLVHQKPSLNANDYWQLIPSLKPLNNSRKIHETQK
jgi:hypothetical protein